MSTTIPASQSVLSSTSGSRSAGESNQTDRTQVQSTGESTSAVANSEQVNQSPQLTVEEVQGAIDVMNEVMTQMNRNLRFEVDDSTSETVIQVKDASTDELIRQIPTQDTLRLIEHLSQMQNILFETTA